MLNRPAAARAESQVQGALEAKAARRKWNPALHPRDSKGRFIETGGTVRLWGGKHARVVRALPNNRILVQDQTGPNEFNGQRHTVSAQWVSMVARPDGTAPTDSQEKVQEEDEKRRRDPRRGNGVARDDDGDPATPNDPHDTDDRGRPIGTDDDSDGPGDDDQDEPADGRHPINVSALPNQRHQAGRFRDTAALRQHFLDLAERTGQKPAMAQFLRSVAGDDDILQATRNGDLIALRDDSTGRWYLTATGTGERMDGAGDFATPREALSFGEHLNRSTRPPANGAPRRGFDFSAPNLNELAQTWRSSTGENIQAAIQRARQEFDDSAAPAGNDNTPSGVSPGDLTPGDRIKVTVNGSDIEWPASTRDQTMPDTVTVEGTLAPTYDRTKWAPLLDATLTAPDGTVLASGDSVRIMRMPRQIAVTGHTDGHTPEKVRADRVRVGDVVAGGEFGHVITAVRRYPGGRIFTTRSLGGRHEPHQFGADTGDTMNVIPRARRSPEDVLRDTPTHAQQHPNSSDAKRAAAAILRDWATINERAEEQWPDGAPEQFRALAQHMQNVTDTPKGADGYQQNAEAMRSALAALDELDTDGLDDDMLQSLHQLEEGLDANADRFAADSRAITDTKRKRAAAAAPPNAAPAAGGDGPQRQRRGEQEAPAAPPGAPAGATPAPDAGSTAAEGQEGNGAVPLTPDEVNAPAAAARAAKAPSAMQDAEIRDEIVSLMEQEMVGELSGSDRTRMQVLEAEEARRAGRKPKEQPKPKRSKPADAPAGLFAAGQDERQPTAADPRNPFDRPDDEFGTPDMFAAAEGRDTSRLRPVQTRAPQDFQPGDRFVDAEGRTHTVAQDPVRTSQGRMRVVTEDGREHFLTPDAALRVLAPDEDPPKLPEGDTPEAGPGNGDASRTSSTGQEPQAANPAKGDTPAPAGGPAPEGVGAPTNGQAASLEPQPEGTSTVGDRDPTSMEAEELAAEIEALEEVTPALADSTDPLELAYRLRAERRLWALQREEADRWEREPKRDAQGNLVEPSRGSILRDRVTGHGLKRDEARGVVAAVDELPSAKQGGFTDAEWEEIEAEASAEEEYPPTEEQRVIIEGAARRGLDMRVMALAGTGKSTTLKMLSRRMPGKRILYLAFNRSVADEAIEAQQRGEYARNLTPTTANAYANSMVDRDLLDRLKWPRLNDQQIADRMRWRGLVPAGGESLSPRRAAHYANKLLAEWVKSDDTDFAVHHLPEELHDREAVFAAVRPLAERMWANLTDPKAKDKERDLPLSFDHTVKMWALSGRVPDTDVLFWDEAQDVNPVMEGIVRNIRAAGVQIVAVGDSNQAIYGFRGATDALGRLPADATATLTQTFRFGDAVADAGNRFLRLVGSRMRLKGWNRKDSRTGEITPGDETMLIARTNAGVVLGAVEGLQAGRKIAVSGGLNDLRKFLEAAEALRSGKRTTHQELAQFNGMDWDTIREEVSGDKDLKQLDSMFKLMDRHSDSLDALLAAVRLPRPLVQDDGEHLWVKLSFSDRNFESTKGWLKRQGFGYDDVGKRWGYPPPKKGGHASAQERAKVLQKVEQYIADRYTAPATGNGGQVVDQSAPHDLLVSTAHKAKGLESERVRIADDFFTPKQTPEGGIDWDTIPSDEELRLAYVAVTRATDVLDTGSLGWVFDATADEDPLKEPDGDYTRDWEIGDFRAGRNLTFWSEDGESLNEGTVTAIDGAGMTVRRPDGRTEDITPHQVARLEGEGKPRLPVASPEELDTALRNGQFVPPRGGTVRLSQDEVRETLDRIRPKRVGEGGDGGLTGDDKDEASGESASGAVNAAADETGVARALRDRLPDLPSLPKLSGLSRQDKDDVRRIRGDYAQVLESLNGILAGEPPTGDDREDLRRVRENLGYIAQRLDRDLLPDSDQAQTVRGALYDLGQDLDGMLAALPDRVPEPQGAGPNGGTLFHPWDLQYDDLVRFDAENPADRARGLAPYFGFFRQAASASGDLGRTLVTYQGRRWNDDRQQWEPEPMQHTVTMPPRGLIERFTEEQWDAWRRPEAQEPDVPESPKAPAPPIRDASPRSMSDEDITAELEELLAWQRRHVSSGGEGPRVEGNLMLAIMPVANRRTNLHEEQRLREVARGDREREERAKQERAAALARVEFGRRNADGAYPVVVDGADAGTVRQLARQWDWTSTDGDTSPDLHSSRANAAAALVANIDIRRENAANRERQEQARRETPDGWVLGDRADVAENDIIRLPITQNDRDGRPYPVGWRQPVRVDSVRRDDDGSVSLSVSNLDGSRSDNSYVSLSRPDDTFAWASDRTRPEPTPAWRYELRARMADIGDDIATLRNHAEGIDDHDRMRRLQDLIQRLEEGRSDNLQADLGTVRDETAWLEEQFSNPDLPYETRSYKSWATAAHRKAQRALDYPDFQQGRSSNPADAGSGRDGDAQPDRGAARTAGAQGGQDERRDDDGQAGKDDEEQTGVPGGDDEQPADDQRDEESRRRRRGRGGEPGGEGPGAPEGPDNGDDGPLDDDQDEEEGDDDERRRRRRRRRRDRGGNGGPGGGDPGLPHLNLPNAGAPDSTGGGDGSGDEGGDGDGAGLGAGGRRPSDTDSLRNAWRNGEGLTPAEDSPERRAVLAGLADREGLALSPQGGLATYPQTQPDGTTLWRFVQARNGSGLPGITLTSDNADDALTLAGRFEDLADEAGDPFDWHQVWDPASVAAWRDGEGRNLPEALRAVRDDFVQERAGAFTLPADLTTLSDPELEAAFLHGLGPEDEQRVIAEMDRRDGYVDTRARGAVPNTPPANAAEAQARGRALDEALRFGGTDVTRPVPAAPGRLRREFDALDEERFQAATDATGGRLLSPEAEAQGVDPREVFSGRRYTNRQAAALASPELRRWMEGDGQTPGNGRLTYQQYRQREADRVLRDEFADWDEARYQQALAATNGYFFRREYKHGFTDFTERELFSGGNLSARDRWRQYASDELQEWFDLNGGRQTFSQFKQARRDGDRAERHQHEDEQNRTPESTGTDAAAWAADVPPPTVSLDGEPEEDAAFRFGGRDRMQDFAGRAELRPAGDTETVWLGGRQIGAIANIYQATPDREPRWDARPIFGTEQDRSSRSYSRDTAIANLVVQALNDGPADPANPSDRVWDTVTAHLASQARELPGLPPSLRDDPEARARHDRLAALIDAFRAGQSPSGDLRHDLAQARDDLAWLRDTLDSEAGGEQDAVRDLDSRALWAGRLRDGLAPESDLERSRGNDPKNEDDAPAPGAPAPDESVKPPEPAPPAASTPEPEPDPEPVGGLPAHWARVADLVPGDMVRMTGTTKKGKAVQRAGYVAGTGPQLVDVTRRHRTEQMWRTWVTEHPDGTGAAGNIYTSANATAARAEAPESTAPGSPASGAQTSLRSGDLPNRIPTDRDGRGLFPGSTVTGGGGREGTVTGATDTTVAVRWTDGDEDTGLSPTTLTVTDGQRPDGWTPDGQRVTASHVVSDPDGTLLGPVDDVDGDNVTITTAGGTITRSAGELRVTGEVRDAAPDAEPVAGIDEPVAGDLKDGDVVLLDLDGTPTTVAITSPPSRNGDRVTFSYTDTSTGEMGEIDVDARAVIPRAQGPDGNAPNLGPDDAPGANDDLVVHPPPRTVNPVTGPPLDPELTPRSRDVIGDHADGPDNDPAAHQAAVRITGDLPITSEQATALAAQLRASADPSTPEGRAALRAANQLERAAGRTPPPDLNRPTPATVATLTDGDLVALPDGRDGELKVYRVVDVIDAPGGIRSLHLEDEEGRRHHRIEHGALPVWLLPEAAPPPATPPAPDDTNTPDPADTQAPSSGPELPVARLLPGQLRAGDVIDAPVSRTGYQFNGHRRLTIISEPQHNGWWMQLTGMDDNGNVHDFGLHSGRAVSVYDRNRPTPALPPIGTPRDPNQTPQQADVDRIVHDHARSFAARIIEEAIAGTEPAGDIHALREQIAQRLTAEALREARQTVRRDGNATLDAAGLTGRERAAAQRRLLEARNQAHTDTVRAALRTINDLEPLPDESREDLAARARDLLRLIPEQTAARSQRTAPDADRAVTRAVTRHTNDAVNTLLAQLQAGGVNPGDAERIARILTQQMAGSRQATARRIAARVAAANPTAGRQPGLLARIVALLVRMAKRFALLVQAAARKIAEKYRSARERLRRLRAFLGRMARRVRQWPESRRLARLHRAVNLPDADGDSLAGRISHWAGLMPEPGRFGQSQRRVTFWRPTTWARLAAGRLPDRSDRIRWTPDRAADGGPGLTGLRHLAALRAAGSDVDQDVTRRLAAALGDDFDDDPHGTLQHADDYVAASERRVVNLQAARSSGTIPDDADLEIEITAARAELASARREYEDLRARYAAAVPNAVAAALADIRDMGPAGTSALVFGPDTDPDAERAVRGVQQLIPRSWLNTPEARRLTAVSGSQGRYEPGGQRVTVADLADDGLGTAGYALAQHFARHLGDLDAAQRAFWFTQTHTGRPGARRMRRSALYWLLRRQQTQPETGDTLARSIQAMFSGDWYQDDDLRAFLLGLMATR
ncbi:UvrD-helicase domain-containing protein [Streptomyces sp. NPDC047315]|uniref:UvrD-helicase domain-containing protein n=1 Tax=Streptomyces sp. NPDC047315 TaxID=3155142 RepID=UPI0033F71D93